MFSVILMTERSVDDAWMCITRSYWIQIHKKEIYQKKKNFQKSHFRKGKLENERKEERWKCSETACNLILTIVYLKPLILDLVILVLILPSKKL